MEIKSAWDFVERYYPKYTSSNEIAYNNDLHVILEETDEEGSCARELREQLERDNPSMNGSWPGKITFLDTLIAISDSTIYQAAIEGYIAELNRPKLSEKVWYMIMRAAKTTGTYNPEEMLFCFEEDLLLTEVDLVRDFLQWVHDNGKTFGSANQEQVFEEFLASR